MKSCRSIILLLTVLLPLSCVEEDMLLMNTNRQNAPAVENAGDEGLVRNPATGYWTAQGRRVPLVGAGRTIDDLSSAIVEVLSANKGLNNVTDLDITNCADFSGIRVNAVGNRIISVKDMYRTYAPGQKVGFVLGNNENTVLGADVLSFFVIQLYNDGQPAGEFRLGESDGETLNLDVLKLTSTGNNGQQVIEVTAEQPFDEVALGMAGVGADIGEGSLGVYYAFVGETPEEDIYSDTGASIKTGIFNWTSVADAHPEDLLDSNDDEGVLVYETVAGLWPVHYLTVDFGSGAYFKEGTELGFKYTQGSALSIKLLSSVTLTAYDSNWDETGDEYKTSGLLGLSAISGTQGAYSLMTTNDRTRGLQIYWAGINVEAGALVLDRVYKRDPIVMDATSYFTAPEEITVSKSSYGFMKPLVDKDGKTGNVTLTITDRTGEDLADGPEAYINQEDGRIVGMHYGASYTVQAVFSGDAGTFTTETVITREQADQAEPPVYMIDMNNFMLEGSLDPGGITVISGMENPQNITDNDINNSALCVKAISLIDISQIASVVTKDGSDVNTEGNEVRVGFALQANSELLSLWALDFFRIRLFRDGVEVDAKVPASNHSVNLGLLGGSNKIIASVLTDQAFDKVVLQTAGVASVSLSSLKIYYGFYEQTNGDYSEDAGIADWCTEVMTPASHGLWLDFDKSSFTVAGVATYLTDMSNILDESKDTYALLYQAVNAGVIKIDVHFNPVKTNQWLGMIVRDPSGVLNVGALSLVTMNVYSEGQLVQSLGYEDFSVVDLQLIGYGDKNYMEIYPTQGDTVDELELVVGGVNLLNGLQVYGVYMRPDEDGNGIPDCSEDEESDNPDNMFAYPDEYHICSGSDLVVKIQGGVTGTHYRLVFENTDDASEVYTFKMPLSQERQFVIPAGQLPVGRYLLSVEPETGKLDNAIYPEGVEVYVHPKKSTWNGSVSSDWNEWENWNEGTPWTCTDVLIPSGCRAWPVLTGAEGENACCNNIQFGNGAEVVGTHHLKYSRAWVNFTLSSGEYNMFSSPLKDTYTGDMFVTTYDGKEIPADLSYDWCWLKYDGSTCPEGVNRFEPMIYQRVWNRSVQNSTPEGNVDLDIENSLWSSSYNLVADPYMMGKGVLVRPGKEDATGEEVQFCLPKDYTEYEYYDIDTQLFSGHKDAVERTASNSGRFIYENADGKAVFPMHVLLENERPSNMYMAGNPFMCHIDIETFFDCNPAVSEILFLQKNAAGGYAYRTVAKDNAAGQTIAPLEGFIVKVGGIYEETTRFKLYIHFTPDMMTVSGK